MICERCGNEMEYDEGEGNITDGFVCYGCMEMKCNNCHRGLNVKEDTIMILCSCGHTTEVRKEKK